MAWPKIIHREYPSTVIARMSSIRKFIEDSDAVLRNLLGIMSEYLGLPASALGERHIFENHSGSECRVIRNPPKKFSGDKVSLGAHTDFGSLVRSSSFTQPKLLNSILFHSLIQQSFLHHNIIGGLQVLNPISKEWQYIKASPCPISPFFRIINTAHQPLSGHAICNIGDALSIYSGGIL